MKGQAKNMKKKMWMKTEQLRLSTHNKKVQYLRGDQTVQKLIQKLQ